MPRIPQSSKSRAIHDAPIALSCVLDFLAPVVGVSRLHRKQKHEQRRIGTKLAPSDSYVSIEALFYAALSQASRCDRHRTPHVVRYTVNSTPVRLDNGGNKWQRQNSGRQAEAQKFDGNGTPTGRTKLERVRAKGITGTNWPHKDGDQWRIGDQCQDRLALEDSKQHRYNGLQKEEDDQDQVSDNVKLSFATQTQGQPSERSATGGATGDKTEIRKPGSYTRPLNLSSFTSRSKVKETKTTNLADNQYLRRRDFRVVNSALSRCFIRASMMRVELSPSNAVRLDRLYHTDVHGRKSRQERFAEGSHLPRNFFDDVSVVKESARTHTKNGHSLGNEAASPIDGMVKDATLDPALDEPMNQERRSTASRMSEQIKLLRSVRELEEKLEKARKSLARSVPKTAARKEPTSGPTMKLSQPPVVLSKEDYINLVDLYYYSHNSRFSPEATDKSPTPIILNDYSFTLSSDFTRGSSGQETVNEDESYESPLKRVDEMLRERQLREVAVMQVFVDLLLDEDSSNRALYEAYKQLPEPGVAYLPKGIIRIFLQRMSTPWTLSEKSMLRYLALMDDMQKAQVPITVAEWSSAIYLAGRAFRSVGKEEVNRAFQIWNAMERDAGVKGSDITFNILFDIAVRSGSFALGETILREMHSRNLRLNRLGRVSLMYYHGLRKDGDGVRKAYRDFVEAGEIVDTLVLNCVIASLLNAQEPQAAEQVYARMKNLQSQLQKGVNRNNEAILYKHYPDPGGNTIDLEMASNHLGRILKKAPLLKDVLPGHHQELQAQMPLTPNHTTFRSMIAYHATTSGDLDRITVLLQEMTDVFHLPLQTITFQLLFKGFAFHGPVGGPQSVWSVKRLELCWTACRSAIKASEKAKADVESATVLQNTADTMESEKTDVSANDSILPSTTQINAMPPHASITNENPPLSRPPPRRLSDWSEFVLDLAAFPRERLKRLERFHSTMFDEEGVIAPHEKPGVHTYQSPYFQSNAYTAPEPHLDTEEGEYVLPNPSGPGLLHNAVIERDPGSNGESDDLETSIEPPERSKESAHQVVATRALVCWLLRAYARNTKSRSKVEEIFNSVRKIYRPKDSAERESVVRVLRRCLRDCDREGGG